MTRFAPKTPCSVPVAASPDGNPRCAGGVHRGVAALLLTMLAAAGCGDGGGQAPSAPVAPPPSPPPAPEQPPPQPPDDRYALYNNLPPEPWWRDSEPYSCIEEENPDSPWLAADLPDLGGSDPLSLIRYFGNGSYLRYGHMGFTGCTRTTKDPNAFHQDPPADPTYYSRGDIEIIVDIARVPPDASGWRRDDGNRVDFTMSEAVALLNAHVTAYYLRVSGHQWRITFQEGEDFEAPGDGSPAAATMHQYQLVGACPDGCERGAPGGLNRILLNDVAVATGGSASRGSATFGLESFTSGRMGTIVHEIGHGWMAWPHSFAEVPWRAYPRSEISAPNPYSNRYDIMSGSDYFGWDAGMPSTLAINRYSAGWIRPEDVALHREERGAYTLVPPGRRGNQFLVVHSGRRHAFTTLEVLEERPRAYRITDRVIHDPSAPGGRRQPRYEGVFVARYDQTAGTGTKARLGPALYDRNNPDFLTDVGWGNDDHSVIPDRGSRDIGGGVTVAVSRNRDGSYEVTLSGGRTAAFEPWCVPFWFDTTQYDTGCLLDTAVWE